MRFTAFTSYYPYYFTTIIGWFVPAAVFGYTFTGDGCFEREVGVIHLTEPTCVITLSSTTTEEVNFTFENVDPDSVEIASDDVSLTTARTSTTLETSLLSKSQATITVAPWFEEKADDLWFVALSDNQAPGTVESNPVFEDMLPMISAINPIFMTNAGDLIQGSSDEDTVHAMFVAVLDTLEETTVPMYPTPGNHDHNDDLGLYESYFGSIDYSYEYGPAYFIALSSSGSTSRGTVTSDQRAWLAEELAGTDKQTIAYFHHPLSVPSWGKSTCCFEDTTERDDLASVLEAGGIDQVINGHSQGYDWRWLTATDIGSLQAGLYQLISGGGGGNIAQPDGDFHFTLVHVTPDDITHQVFELSDTDIVVDDSEDNKIIVEYDGVTDLPYLRLKFKVSNDVPEYFIATEAGSYLPFQQHTFANYTVLLAETSLSSGTSTFTAYPANTLHTGISQTIDTTGYVAFSTTPTSTDTNTGITVLPNKLTTTISELMETVDGYRWVEQPASRSVNTTYTLSDVPVKADVQVYVNGTLYTRGRSDTDGQFSFEYTPNRLERDFLIVFRTDLTDIVTIPTDSGTAHVRTFSTTGKNTGNFFSAHNRVGEFQLGYGYVTGDDELDWLVTELSTGRVYLHSADGDQLDTIFTTGEVHVADYVLAAQGNALRTYRWSTKKKQLLPFDRLRLANDLIDWTVVDDTVMVITEQSGRARITAYTYADGWKRVQSTHLPRHISDIHVLSCQCDTSTARTSLVVWQKHNTIQTTTYSTDLVKKRSKTIGQSGDIQQVAVGHITNRTIDTVLMVIDNILYPWQVNPSGKLILRPTILSVDSVGISLDKVVVTSNTQPVQVLVYGYNNLLDEFELDESFYPYGETFLGGATLAVP